jgi:hypothetical protein
VSWQDESLSPEFDIPQEIDDHLKLFGKAAEDVDYNSVGECLFCNSRIDEFGYCACGGNLGVS